MVQRKGLLLVTLVLIGLSGCAAGRYWTKPRVSPNELARDDAACRREASEARPQTVGRGGGRTGKVWVNHWRYTCCMRAKGYEWASG